MSLREGEFDVRCVGFVLIKNAECVVHVHFEDARDSDALLFGDLRSLLNGVVHPYFGDYNHERKANRTRVGCGVVGAVVEVVDEVGGGETQLDETDA